MSYRTIFTTTASAAVAASAFGSKSFLKNGSFEVAGEGTTPADWLAFGGERSTAFAFHNDFSVLATVRTNAFVGVFQDTVDAFEGTRIKLRCLVYHPSAAPLVGSVVAGIKLEFRQPGGGSGPEPVENLALTVGSPVDTWFEITLNEIVPPDVDAARIVILGFEVDQANNGAAYIDDAFAALSSAPSTNLLLNPSFQDGSSAANGLTSWTEFADPFSGARRNAFEVPGRTGSAVLKISGRNTAGVFQQINTVPGETLIVSAWGRQRGTTPYGVLPEVVENPNPQAGVKIEWSAGNVPRPDIDIAPNDNPISFTTNVITATSPRDVWIPVTIDYTMENNTGANLRCTAINGFGAAECDVYFDAFEAILKNVFNGTDADGDDDADMVDMAQLQRVYNGSGGGLKFGGLVFDQDDDNDVDTSDAAYSVDRVTGPAVTPP